MPWSNNTVPTVPFPQFFAAHTEVSRELGEVRTREMREFSSAYRFSLILTRAGLDDSPLTQDIARALSLSHMQLLADATDIPSTHCELLADTQQRYRVALVSNFDHAATARHILERDGATEYFEHIVISDEHGWRKPHPRIFTDTLTASELSPEMHCLWAIRRMMIFVGPLGSEWTLRGLTRRIPRCPKSFRHRSMSCAPFRNCVRRSLFEVTFGRRQLWHENYRLLSLVIIIPPLK